MTVIESNPTSLSPQQLGLLMQYTVEAYKTFEKLGESLPNPMAAAMFANFAVEERLHRDLLEAKIAASSVARIKVTLGPDLLFQDILEGDLSYREMTEFLIARERTMQRRLEEIRKSAPESDRYMLIYLTAAKRSHIVELERELELIRLDADWFRREDAEFRISVGPKPA
jgi:rubrerythrin